MSNVQLYRPQAQLLIHGSIVGAAPNPGTSGFDQWTIATVPNPRRRGGTGRGGDRTVSTRQGRVNSISIWVGAGGD